MLKTLRENNIERNSDLHVGNLKCKIAFFFFKLIIHYENCFYRVFFHRVYKLIMTIERIKKHFDMRRYLEIG